MDNKQYLSFEQFLKVECSAVIVAWKKYHGVSQEEAQDAFLEAVARIWLRMKAGETPKINWYAWTWSVAAGYWQNEKRKTELRKKPIYLKGLAAKLYEDIVPEEVSSLITVIHKLSTVCQSILEYFCQSYNNEEISNFLGYANESVVRNQKSRCIKSLKQMWELTQAL